jgi:hypothetical protein
VRTSQIRGRVEAAALDASAGFGVQVVGQRLRLALLGLLVALPAHTTPSDPTAKGWKLKIAEQGCGD